MIRYYICMGPGPHGPHEDVALCKDCGRLRELIPVPRYDGPLICEDADGNVTVVESEDSVQMELI